MPMPMPMPAQRRRQAPRLPRKASGRALRDAAVLARIRALAVPPAWQQVWICADDGGHLQATGRDARGRKQYRYHRAWQACRGQTKFDGLRNRPVSP